MTAPVGSTTRSYESLPLTEAHRPLLAPLRMGCTKREQIRTDMTERITSLVEVLAA